MNQKREMPENIRKMFEQRKLASNNSSNAPVKPVAEQIKPSSLDAEEIKEEVKTEQKEQISQNNDLLDNTKNDITQDLNNEVVNDQPIEQPKQDKKEKTAKPKKEKIVKEKKQKEQKEKKKLSKKAKTIITISAIAFVLIIAVVVLVIMLIPKVEKMSTPKLKVYTLSNQVMIYVDKNDNADYYEFYIYIQRPGETPETKVIPENNNFIYIKEYLNQVGEYTIWARYGSNNEKAVSDISNKEKVIYTKQLDKINDATLNLETNELTFSRVNNAISYRIYYGAGENEYITQISPTSIGSIKVNLADKLQAGNYNLTIQAIADANSYYTNSELSSSINFVYKTTLRPITSATYTKSTSNLTLSLDIEKTNTSKFKISIKFKNDLNALSFEKQFDEVLNSQTLDLSFILSKYSKASSDVDSITIIALGSEYVNNSTEVYATIYD